MSKRIFAACVFSLLLGAQATREPRSAWSTLSTSGCLGRSVADLAFALSTIAGPDSRAPLSINEPGEHFARPLNRSFEGVRVAWFKDLAGAPLTHVYGRWWMRIARRLSRWDASSIRRSPISRPPRSPFACCFHGIRQICTVSVGARTQRHSRTL